MPTASKTAHTPGPWHVDGRTIVSRYAVIPPTHICRVDTYNPKWAGHGGNDVNEANARLIAAAPALLAACEAAERLLAVAAHVGDTDAHCLEVTWDDAERVVVAARAAIAAAKGD